MDVISASTRRQLEQVLRATDISVPGRTEGRTTEHCERYAICRWLVTLANENLLRFPLRVVKRERPDFELQQNNAGAAGIEITEAIPTDYSSALAMKEKESSSGIIDMSFFKLGETRTADEIREIIHKTKLEGVGWGDSMAEKEVAGAVRFFADLKTRKLRKPGFRKFPANLLLILENMPRPHLDQHEAGDLIEKALQGCWGKGIIFDRIYVDSDGFLHEMTPEHRSMYKIRDIWRNQA